MAKMTTKEAPARTLDRWGRANNTLFVGPGCKYTTVEAAVGAATAGYLDPNQINLTGTPADGEYLTITAKGGSGADDAVVYWFDAEEDGTPPESVPSGAVTVLATELDPWASSLIAAVNANQASYITAASGSGDGVLLQIIPAGGYTYLEVDLSGAPSLAQTEDHYHCDSTMPVTEIRLGPGEYVITDTLKLYSNMHLVGESREGCVIRQSEATPSGLELGAQNCSVQNVTVECPYTEGATSDVSAASTVKMDAIEGSSDFLVAGCKLVSNHWNFTGDGLRGEIRDNYLVASNPFNMGSTKYCRFANNVCHYMAQSSQCIALLDHQVSSADFRNVIKGNVIIAERTSVTSPNHLVYAFQIGGCGHVVEDNTVVLLVQNWPADKTLHFLRIGMAAVPGDLGAVADNPIRFDNNTFRIYVNGATQPTSVRALEIAVTGDDPAADVYLRNNRFLTDSSAAKVAIDASNASGSSTIYVEENGLGGFESGSVTLSNVTLSHVAQIVRPPISVANVTDGGPTDAELDSAFGTPANLGEGFIGLVNDADGGVNNFICWVSDGKWAYLKGTVAT